MLRVCQEVVHNNGRVTDMDCSASLSRAAKNRFVCSLRVKKCSLGFQLTGEDNGFGQKKTCC